MVGNWTTSRVWVLGAAAALALAGCSGGDTSGGSDGSASSDGGGDLYGSDGGSTDGATDAAGGGDAAAGATTVAVGSTSLGDVLVDGDGMTLYMFDSDTQGGESTCYDGCASAWPPLLTDGDPAAGDGADGGMLGTVERTDGTMQVTYDGWPLYYWAQDSAAGDVNGQGVNDVWWVLGPDGTPVRG
jgi:predicted lipoprotein with Yx(FWY)xxD motif